MKDSELEKFEKLWEVKQVLADLLPTKSSVEVFAAQIQPKVASLLIRKLNLCAPLPSLSHVKRARRIAGEDGVELSIILCLAPCGSCEWSSSNAPSEVFSVVEEHQLIPFVAKVPQHEACSREEWEDQCRLWPTSYHPNAVKLHQVVNFEETEVQVMCKFMRTAIRQAKCAAKSDQGQLEGCNCSDVNADDQSSNQKSSWHPLRHAVMVAIERAAERKKADKDDNAVSSGVSTKRLRINETNGYTERLSFVGDRYLCRGFDAYVTREPCSMCAMALLHQRVRRVFYGISNTKIGALGGLHRLHGMQGLNHHYLVFQVCLSEEDLVG